MRKTIIFLLGILVLGTLFSLNSFGQANLPPSPIKTIYVVPSSHYDFGFVEPPNAIRERAARHIDEVIRVAEANPDFRWTIESVWQVNEWLKRQKKPSSVLPKDKEKIGRLIKLLKSGQVVLSTAWGSMHTDYMGAEELNRLTYDFAALQRDYGITSELAYMNDVPGHPMPIASLLGSTGTKYLVTGANTFLNQATELAPGKVPFYWQAPDGNKVLLWISQSKRGAYVEALTLYYLDPYTKDPYTDRTSWDMFNPDQAGKKTDIEVMEIGVADLLKYYNDGGYKYDSVMAMYAHDFLEPENVLNLERAAKMWNTKHPEVQIKVATPPEFFKYIERKYGSQIPTYKGEWSGLWSEAKTASPRISAAGRFSHDHAPLAETLWSAVGMTRKLPVPVGNFSEVYDLMFTYDEHSGAGNTGWPQLNSSEPLRQQNREYVELTSKAKAETEQLISQGLRALADPSRFDDVKAKQASIVPLMVYNGLAWKRNDVVQVAPPGKDLKITGVRSLKSGTAVPFDIDEHGNAVFVARDVPAMGYVCYEITTATGQPATTLRVSSGSSIDGAHFTVALNSDGTVRSFRDKKANRELVNTNGLRPFNDLVRVEGNDASKVAYPVAPNFSIRKGIVMSEITVMRERSSFPLTKITIYNDVDRVELHNELDPKRIPFVGGNNNWHDSYYFAFPFNIPKEGLKVMRGGQRWFDALPDDYLPGARMDAVSTQHLIGLAGRNVSAYMAHRQAYHFLPAGYVPVKVRSKDAPQELPAMLTGKYPLPEATLFARATRWGNQADTADSSIINLEVEPGLQGNMSFDFAFAGGASFDHVRAWHMGSELNVPLLPQYLGVLPAHPVRSFFSVDQPNVDIVVVKPVAESATRGEVTSAPLNPKVSKAFVVRLQEFVGRAATVKVTVPAKIRSASLMNITESLELGKVTQIDPLTVSLKPYECATVRIEIE
ncbi:MAG TPA: glycosyl hydrolase-related protein [Pyrinomonadaceae bacterium]|nr:glycosyl hydrolase-related protein [Pyrinomonadaceae bacterium]